MAPRLIPEDPRFTTDSERAVWARLRDTLRDEDTLIANYRLTDSTKDHEADLVVLMPGYGIVDEQGTIAKVGFKYLKNLFANPWLLLLLLAGLASLLYSVWHTTVKEQNKGIWFGGLGTVLVGLTVLTLPAYNNTSFYPSKVDLQSSLTIYNASSSPYTLTVMTYVALGIPFVLGYIAYVWWAMDRGKMRMEDANDQSSY